MKYVYPAVFQKEENGNFSVNFPDLQGANTCGRTLTEALYMAQDCLGLVLYGIEEDNEEFPQASDINKFKNSEKSFTTLVCIDLNEYKKMVDNKPVKKTLYIPKNLNDQAELLGLNFSELLRQALKQKMAQN